MFAQYIRNTVRSTLTTTRSVVLDSDCNPICAEIVGNLKCTRQLATNGDLVVKRTYSAEGVTTLFFRVEWAELVPTTEGTTQLKDAIEMHPALAAFMDLKGPDLLPERFVKANSIADYVAATSRRSERDALIRSDLNVAVRSSIRDLAHIALESADALVAAVEGELIKGHLPVGSINSPYEAVGAEAARRMIGAGVRFARGLTTVARMHIK